MKEIRLIILSLVITSQAYTQDVIHLCLGDDYNFGVPYTNGSSYYWKVYGDPNIATITSGDGTEHITIDLNNKGVFTLLVEEIDANGCNGYDSILVEIFDLPIANISALGPTTFCEGDSVLLQIDSVYSTFLWSDSSNSNSIYVDTTSNYFVTVTDSNGCSNNSNSISVYSYASPIANFSVDGSCLGTATNFNNQSITTESKVSSYIWHLGNGDIKYRDSISYFYNVVGDYIVSLCIQTDEGCKDSTSQIVSIFDIPKADFSYNPFTISTLNPEINFASTTINTIPLLWDFGDSVISVNSNPSHIYDDPGIYDVLLIVEDVNECKDSIIKHIIMYYDFVLYVPTAFTPDNDDDNDRFGPVGLRMDKYMSYNFQIYNKWGERIFETSNINEWWSGADFPSEVYNWIIVVTDELGEIRKRNGIVTLIR
jgi:gliding motility-associated-like protein